MLFYSGRAYATVFALCLSQFCLNGCVGAKNKISDVDRKEWRVGNLDGLKHRAHEIGERSGLYKLQDESLPNLVDDKSSIQLEVKFDPPATRGAKITPKKQLDDLEAALAKLEKALGSEEGARKKLRGAVLMAFASIAGADTAAKLTSAGKDADAVKTLLADLETKVVARQNEAKNLPTAKVLERLLKDLKQMKISIRATRTHEGKESDLAIEGWSGGKGQSSNQTKLATRLDALKVKAEGLEARAKAAALDAKTSNEFNNALVLMFDSIKAKWAAGLTLPVAGVSMPLGLTGPRFTSNSLAVKESAGAALLGVVTAGESAALTTIKPAATPPKVTPTKRDLLGYLPSGLLKLQKGSLELDDNVQIDIEVFPDDSKDSESLAHAQYQLHVDEFGWRSSVRTQGILYRRTSGGEGEEEWKLNLAALFDFNYRERGDGWFFNSLEPGFGVHVASLDQGEDNIELGLGVNVTFKKGLVSLGWGHNMMEKDAYYFIGGDILGIVNSLTGSSGK